MVFRQSLRVSPKQATCDMPEYHTYEKAFVKEGFILNLIPDRSQSYSDLLGPP